MRSIKSKKQLNGLGLKSFGSYRMFLWLLKMHSAFSLLQPEGTPKTEIHIFLNMAHLEKMMRVCRHTITKYRNELVDAGYITAQLLRIAGKGSAYYIYITEKGINFADQKIKKEKWVDEWNEKMEKELEELGLCGRE